MEIERWKHISMYLCIIFVLINNIQGYEIRKRVYEAKLQMPCSSEVNRTPQNMLQAKREKSHLLEGGSLSSHNGSLPSQPDQELIEINDTFADKMTKLDIMHSYGVGQPLVRSRRATYITIKKKDSLIEIKSKKCGYSEFQFFKLYGEEAVDGKKQIQFEFKGKGPCIMTFRKDGEYPWVVVMIGGWQASEENSAVRYIFSANKNDKTTSTRVETDDDILSDSDFKTFIIEITDKQIWVRLKNSSNYFLNETYPNEKFPSGFEPNEMGVSTYVNADGPGKSCQRKSASWRFNRCRIDEDCPENAKCETDSAEYKVCHCQEGFEGDVYLDSPCKDINECENNNGRVKCEHNCNNTIGSYKCTCNGGFTLADDQISCEVDVEPTVNYKVAGIIGGFIILLILTIVILIIVFRKRKQNKKPALAVRYSVSDGNNRHSQPHTYETLDEINRTPQVPVDEPVAPHNDQQDNQYLKPVTITGHAAKRPQPRNEPTTRDEDIPADYEDVPPNYEDVPPCYEEYIPRQNYQDEGVYDLPSHG